MVVSTCSDSMNRTDPIHVLMTGATSGIGLEAVRRLSEQGHQLTLLCRDASKADQQLGWLNNRSTVRIVDLAFHEELVAEVEGDQ